jgi:hypothetical protein
LEWWIQLRPSEADLHQKPKSEHTKNYQNSINTHHSKSLRKKTNKRVSLRIRKENNIQRIVVLPALSRPRTRIRASLLPNTEENILENKIPIFFIAKWEIV